MSDFPRPSVGDLFDPAHYGRSIVNWGARRGLRGLGDVPSGLFSDTRPLKRGRFESSTAAAPLSGRLSYGGMPYARRRRYVARRGRQRVRRMMGRRGRGRLAMSYRALGRSPRGRTVGNPGRMVEYSVVRKLNVRYSVNQVLNGMTTSPVTTWMISDGSAVWLKSWAAAANYIPGWFDLINMFDEFKVKKLRITITPNPSVWAHAAYDKNNLTDITTAQIAKSRVGCHLAVDHAIDLNDNTPTNAATLAVFPNHKRSYGTRPISSGWFVPSIWGAIAQAGSDTTAINSQIISGDSWVKTSAPTTTFYGWKTAMQGIAMPQSNPNVSGQIGTIWGNTTLFFVDYDIHMCFRGLKVTNTQSSSADFTSNDLPLPGSALTSDPELNEEH